MIKIVPFVNSLTDVWDDFCLRSSNATFLHTRKYINYHKDRFSDHSLLLVNDKDEVIGLFPAAESLNEPGLVISHPGISYGGLIVTEKLYGERVISVMKQIIEYFKELDFSSIQYKAVPYIYHKRPFQDDLYALFRLNAQRYRCDLSSIINLSHKRRASSRRIRSLKKARKYDISITSGSNNLDPYWNILEENLNSKYGAKPTHSLAEIKQLMITFPQDIELQVAKDAHTGNMIAGIVLYHTETVTHTQYIASNKEGHRLSALDLLFDSAIEKSVEREINFFSFGISNENEGQYLNQTLYQFKHEFGAGGIAHDFFLIKL